MDPWNLGLIVLVVVGLGVIVFGALWDRRRNARRAVEMLAPPARAIPGFAPDAPAPHYLSDLQARRPPTDLDAGPGPEQHQQLLDRLAGPGTLTVPVGSTSHHFVTDPESGLAVLDRPAVVVCADRVGSLREVLSTVERLLLAGRPFALVAPEFSPEVLTTLEVNRIRRILAVVAVVAGPEDARAIADACGATPLDRQTLQSGWVDESSFGGCAVWASSARDTTIVPTGPVG